MVLAPECSATALPHVGSSVCLLAAVSGQPPWCHLGGWHVFGKGVRTGGRLHPGPAGERPPKQRPKPCSCSYGRPCRGSWRLTGRLRCPFLDPGYDTECAFLVLRSLPCLPACPLCLRTVFTCLPTPTRTFYVPVAFGGFAPVALPGLGSLASPVNVPGNLD